MPFYTSFSELIPQIQGACKSRKGFSRLTSIRLPIRLILKTKMPKPQALTARSALTAVAPGAEPGTRRRLRSCPTAASEAARSLQPPSRPRSPRGGRLARQDEQEDHGTGEAAELSLAKPLLPLSRWLQTGRAWRRRRDAADDPTAFPGGNGILCSEHPARSLGRSSPCPGPPMGDGLCLQAPLTKH